MFFFGLLKSRNAWVGLMSVIVLSLLTAAGADRAVVIEDWLSDAVSRKGIPSGWRGEAFGQRADYDFTIEQGAGRRIIHLGSRDEHSTIVRDITGKVNLKETPILEWTWKATILRRAATYGGKKPRIGRSIVCCMAAISRTPSLADYRICLGCDDSCDDNREEPKDRNGHIRGDAIRIRRPRQVVDRAPQCR
jgi:hypothetical protein